MRYFSTNFDIYNMKTVACVTIVSVIYLKDRSGKMFLTGYHGTTIAGAEGIISEGCFHLSKKDTEWLGDGIYFYFSIEDAYEWRDTEAIFHTVIKIEDKEYLDIDTEEGKEIFKEICKCVAKSTGLKVNVQKNQCAVMRMIWDTNPQLKAISASFYKEKTEFPTLIDTREKRKEFCIRDNSCIKCKHLIKRGDLDG